MSVHRSRQICQLLSWCRATFVVLALGHFASLNWGLGNAVASFDFGSPLVVRGLEVLALLFAAPVALSPLLRGRRALRANFMHRLTPSEWIAAASLFAAIAASQLSAGNALYRGEMFGFALIAAVAVSIAMFETFSSHPLRVSSIRPRHHFSKRSRMTRLSGVSS